MYYTTSDAYALCPTCAAHVDRLALCLDTAADRYRNDEEGPLLLALDQSLLCPTCADLAAEIERD